MGDYANHLNLTGWGPEITKTDYIPKVIELVRRTHPVGTFKRNDPQIWRFSFGPKMSAFFQNSVFLLFTEDIKVGMDYVQSVIDKSVNIVTAGGMNRTDDAKFRRGVSSLLCKQYLLKIVSSSKASTVK